MRSRTARARRVVALVVILVASAAFLVRLVDVQIVSAAELNEEAKGKRAVPVTIPSARGDIVDRDGDVLATTEQRYDVQLSPKNTRLNGGKFHQPDPEGVGTIEVTSAEAFAQIGEVTGQTADEIQEIVDEALAEDPKSDFAYVKRSVDLVQLEALKELGIPWLTFEVQHTRVYPNGAVGGNVIGFAGSDGVPQAGVEISQEECLVGVDGAESYERGADGVPLPGSAVVDQEAVDGGTVHLSIDRDLQWEAQQTINEKVQDVQAEWGLLVVMDARTGELVAVAGDNSVDPNNVDATEAAKREARSFTYPYEPGSTFKTITMASLIDQGVASPTTPYATPDYIEPEPGVRIGDSFNHGIKQWTLAGILTESSNVGTAMLGSQLSPEVRYDYLRKFGLGEATNAGLPLEDSGLLHPVENWDRQTNYNIMFGQGLSSTIVQTAGIYQAIANGGERIPPSLVKSCVEADGTTTHVEHGEAVQVVDEATSRTMLGMLETVVLESWWTDTASIPGYRIGGKTGTAEQADGQGGYREDFVYSFAGIFPIDNPQYVVVSSVAYPQSGDGAMTAISAFHDAAEATIRTFQIPPSSGTPKTYPTEY